MNLIMLCATVQICHLFGSFLGIRRSSSPAFTFDEYAAFAHLEPLRMSRPLRSDDDAAVGTFSASAIHVVPTASQLLHSESDVDSPATSSFKRARIDPGGSPCYLDRCADVELQLVLLLLLNQERLIAATVSRRMLHAISHPFSWRYASLFTVVFDVVLAERLQRSLMRMAPISLSRPFDDGSTAAEVAAVPNVHVLWHRTDAVSGAFNEAFLALPEAQSLREFHIDLEHNGCDTTAIAVQHAARLPLLHTIELSCTDHGNEYLQPLGSAPALTHVKLSAWQCFPSDLFCLSSCQHLRKLELGCVFAFSVGSFARIFGGSFASSLEYLQLHFSYPHITMRLPPDEYAAVFAGLKRLHTLLLEQCSDVDSMISQLHHAASLRLLRVTSCYDHSHPCTRPGHLMLRSLLTALPALRCEVQLSDNHPLDAIIMLMRVPRIQLTLQMSDDGAPYGCSALIEGPSQNITSNRARFTFAH
jgi:hypothetical protein